MMGLTVSQPHASLIADGSKFVENRTWSTGYRGLLAIHAGKGSRYLSRADLATFTTSAIVAVAVLRVCVNLDHLSRAFENGVVPECWEKAGLNELDMEKVLSHEHTEGPVCWVLSDIHKLGEPLPCSGARGLWPATIPLSLPMTITGVLGSAVQE